MTSGDPNGLRILAKHTQLAPEEIKYLPNADASVIDTIDRSVLFLIAFWSGSSILSFRRLTEVLTEANAQIELVVVDVDGCSRTMYKIPGFRGVFGGNGETAWVRQGKVIASTFGLSDRDALTRNVATLTAAGGGA